MLLTKKIYNATNKVDFTLGGRTAEKFELQIV